MNFEIVIVIMTLSSIIFGYLSGSVLYSVIIGKVFYKKDLRNYESKNAGATNSLRVYGKKVGAIVLLLDIMKSFLPALILWLIFRNTIDQYIIVTESFNPYVLVQLAGLFALLGHCYPVFFKFKGGKGASCYGGFVLCVNPFIGLICIIMFTSISKMTKYVSLSSVLTAWLPFILIFIPGVNYSFLLNVPIYTLLIVDVGTYWVLFISGLFFISSVIITYKHKTNIVRLLNGTERKTTSKKS